MENYKSRTTYSTSRIKSPQAQLWVINTPCMIVWYNA
jgi:hypothetical protein